MRIKLLPILLNGKMYVIDPTGMFAINTANEAVRLEDKPKESRFR